MAKCRARNFWGPSTKHANTLGTRVELLVVNTVRSAACLETSRQKDSLRTRLGHGFADEVGIATAFDKSVVYVRRAKVSSIVQQSFGIGEQAGCDHGSGERRGVDFCKDLMGSGPGRNHGRC